MCMDADSLVRAAPRPDPDTEPPEPIPLAPVDGVTITTLVDNVSDMLLADEGPAVRSSLVGPSVPTTDASVIDGGRGVDALHAEHGFSSLVTIERGRHTCRILFDAGLSPGGMVGNMRRLGIDPGDVDVVVLSHGHLDHTTGLSGFVDAVGRANVPLLLHPDAWLTRRIAIPGREPVELPAPSRRALTDAGFELIERPEASLLLDGAVLVTGEVDRTTDFEQGFAVHEARRAGTWTPDPLILDDQALVVNVAGRGLVVLTGCGHAGVVNILRHARRLTGEERVHAVLGGFHLSGALFEPIIPATVDALADLAPEVVVPAHCTGWRATHAIAAAMPDAFIQNSVGTRFTLAA